MKKSVVVNFVTVAYSTKFTEATCINFLAYREEIKRQRFFFTSIFFFFLFQLRKNVNEIIFNIIRYINIYIMYLVCSISCHSYTTFTKRETVLLGKIIKPAK